MSVSPSSIRTDTGPGDLPRIVIANALGSAEIFLDGGHVARFQPAGERPVLWMSEASNYIQGKAIRGGVPVCFPWFGPHPTDSTLGAHGFARFRRWTLERTAELADGRSQVELSFTTDAATRKVWPHDARLSLLVTVGRTLELVFTVTNTGTAPFICAEAFHTYFTVADIKRTEVTGLEGVRYLDKVDPGVRHQQGPVTFAGECDRVYEHTGEAVIVDRVWNRTISIAKRGSASTVVWNPWIAKAAKMVDYGNDEWTGMVCVETANALDAVVVVPPAFSHHLTAIIGTAPLAGVHGANGPLG